jgi:hypothetical protein
MAIIENSNAETGGEKENDIWRINMENSLPACTE